MALLSADEVHSIVGSSKMVEKYSGRDVEAMKKIAEASKKRSLADFEKVFIQALILTYLVKLASLVGSIFEYL